MDATTLRQKVLSNNLANANTPGYRRKDVNFSDALADAVRSRRIDQIRDVKPEVYEDKTAALDSRGNSVSVQREMGEISQNELLYNFAAEMTSRKFNSLSKAIKETK